MGSDSRSATPWTNASGELPHYDFYWYGLPGYEKEDIARLKAFLATFTFTR